MRDYLTAIAIMFTFLGAVAGLTWLTRYRSWQAQCVDGRLFVDCVDGRQTSTTWWASCRTLRADNKASDREPVFLYKELCAIEEEQR